MKSEIFLYNFPMTSYAIRPATENDIPEISRLIIQLYQSELPGALTGNLEMQGKLLRFTLEANGESALQNRYVLCDESGNVIGTGMIEFSGDKPYDRAPNGTVSKAFQTIGFKATLRLLGTVARSLVGVYQHRDSSSALIHSVVVERNQRGRGAGKKLMQDLELVIRKRGVTHMRLQVLESNAEARHFYEKLGYQEIWRSSWWQALLSWRNLVMEKRVA